MIMGERQIAQTLLKFINAGRGSRQGNGCTEVGEAPFVALPIQAAALL